MDKDIFAFSATHFYKYYKQEINKKMIADLWEINSKGSFITNYIQLILVIVKLVTQKVNTSSIRKWLVLILPSFLFVIWIILIAISFVLLGLQLRSM